MSEKATEHNRINAIFTEARSKVTHTSVVYFAHIVRTGHIKIGYTDHLYNRMAGLRSAWQSDVELLGIISGSRTDESRIHRQLNKSRVPDMREVFYPTEEVQGFIQQLNCNLEAVLKIYCLDQVAPYESRKPEWFQATPKKTRKECAYILRSESLTTRQKFKRRLALKLIQSAANGFDISECARIFVEFLGANDEG